MKLATPAAFARDPEEVHAFYNLRRASLIRAKPNTAHEALARLEAGLKAMGGQLFLCTQNVDDLHERAGSRHVVHMHGELLKARCTNCAMVDVWRGDLAVTDACPACGHTGTLRPDVVWFGETPFHMDAIDAVLRSSDMFVAIGTSGAVYPAAGLAGIANRTGIRTCEINLEVVGMFSRRPYVEITFSAVNRHPDSKFLSLQFVGLRETNDVVLALSAEPGMSMASANSNEQVTASVNVTDGELREITRFCIRADGDFL